MIVCIDYLTCNSFGDQDRCGYAEKEKQKKWLKVSGGAGKLLCFIHLAVHGITGDVIIECGQGPHRGPVLRNFTGCWNREVFFFFFSCARMWKYCKVTALMHTMHSFYFSKEIMCVCVCVLTTFQKEVFSFLLPTLCPPPCPLEWGRGRLNGIWSFPAEKGTFCATRSMFKGLML